jgi:hypothetical protein
VCISWLRKTVPLCVQLVKLTKPGHKTGTMTQRYAHHCPESLRDGVNVLENRPPIDTNLSQLGGSLKAGSSKSLIYW